MRELIADVLDVGIWTWGLVSAVALPWVVLSMHGPQSAAQTAGFVAVAIVILGISGARAVDSVDSILGGRSS